MNPHDIKAELAKRNFTQTAISKEFDISSEAVHRVIFRKSGSARIEKRISKILGKPRSQVFSEIVSENKP